MRKYHLALLIIIILISCQNNNDNTIFVEKFNTISLKADSLHLSGKIIFPRKIFQLGEHIALFEDRDNDGFIHFYTLEGQYLTKICRIGNSNDEFISPNVFKNGNDILVISLKGNYKRISSDEDEIIEHDMLTIMNKDLAVGNNFIADLMEKGYILDNPKCSEMLTFIPSSGERLDYSVYPSDFPKKIDNFFKKNVLSVYAASISTSLDSLFLAYTYYPSVMIVTPDGQICSFNRLKEDKKNDFFLKDNIPYFKEPTLFYTYTVSSKNYYYALYQNSTMEEMKAGGKSEIHKFNKNGALIDRYILDRRIYNFDVSSNDCVIYALGINSDSNSEIYYYRMDT